MTDGEALFLWIGLITGGALTLLFLFTLDYLTYLDLQKRLKRERGKING